MLRSALAVAAGSITTLVLIGLMVLLLGILFPQAVPAPESSPSIPWAAFILLYFATAAIVGSAVTTTSCRGIRINHVHALAIVVVFVGLAMLAANIDSQPIWFLSAQIIMLVFGVYVGGHFANKRFPEIAPRG